MLGLIDKLLSLFDDRKLPCEVGYQRGNGELLSAMKKYKGQVTDVYFTLPCEATYYGAWGVKSDGVWQNVLFEGLLADMDKMRQAGFSAIVCVDASCYGMNLAAEALMKHISKMLVAISEHIRIKAVTTSSLPLAEYLLNANPNLKVRASEWMHLMNVRQLSMLQHLFTGYYIGYDGVRDVEEIIRMRKWCDDNGRTLHIVPNNACLYWCPYYIYHGNVQSHNQEVLVDSKRRRELVADSEKAPCERLLAKPENRVRILKGVWIRPEDMRHVSYYFDSMRLATRTKKDPQNIVQAYCEGHWDGNLCDILEAMHEHSAVFPVIHNDRFPKDWFKKTSRCGHLCDSCHYCEDVLKMVAGD